MASSTPAKAAASAPPPHSPLHANAPDRSTERDTPRKIIAISREIFIANMSIQTVTDEIQSVKERAREIEETSQQRCLKMEEKAKQLGAELIKSEDDTSAAVKEAERMTALRLKKTRDLLELKRQCS